MFTAKPATREIILSEVHNVSPAQAAYLLSAWWQGADISCHFPKLQARPRFFAGSSGAGIVIVKDGKTAEQIASDINFLCRTQAETVLYAEGCARYFPGWDVLPFDVVSPTPQVVAQRLELLDFLKSRVGDPDCESPGKLLIVPADALMQRVPSRASLVKASLTLTAGQKIQRDYVAARLLDIGYRRVTLVEEYGQCAVRGAVIDVFTPGFPGPLRVEFLGDEIDSLRLFDQDSQRTREIVGNATILPAREFLPDLSAAGASAFAQLRARAEQLAIPFRDVKALEEQLLAGVFVPGVEQLQPLLGDIGEPLFDYFSSDLPIFMVDRESIERTLDEHESLVEERIAKAEHEGRLSPRISDVYLRANQVQQELRSRAHCAFNPFPLIQGSLDTNDKTAARPQLYSNEKLRSELEKVRQTDRPLKPIADDIRQLLEHGNDVLLVSSHPPRLTRMEELLAGYQLPTTRINSTFFEWSAERTARSAGTGAIWSFDGQWSEGIRVPGDHVYVFIDNDFFPELSPRKRAQSHKHVRKLLGAISQLKEDDFIVHVEHGVGLYRGLKQLTVEGKVGDFLLLEYADEAKLYLPVEQLGNIQKYVGAEGRKPTLSKLGTKTWIQQKAKVRQQVEEIAGQLIKLYAQREMVEGYSFGPIDGDDHSFADSFPYEETVDQAKAIDDVLRDMGGNKPMDRLVCGDVGYGKTEVALRAAFKAANGGKQVAILVPTTILADQHYSTFRERFANFPIKVGCVNRFMGPAENKLTLEKLHRGEIDIIVGTHRLLQKDVSFRDLGLVIVDEEHRFGVAHKERLKKFRKEIDVLTLTATPIPRTLHMSLSGIRDLSVIETAPVDRQVTRTYLAEINTALIREAIVRELGRQGQVFYIHNRVQNIFAVAGELHELVPEARIAVGHGQMKESELEDVMHKFTSGQVDVLVSTTIVESGLDIPNANTIIIRHADMFGLAELYQLRGRVGRGSRRAYAYLMISDPKKLGTEARKRLEVLQALDDLGVGFRLALQDMEIRGAGNLLGKDQSGQISTVGYELYSKILKEAITELRRRERQQAGQPQATKIEIDPEVHIGFPAHIPIAYIPDVAERLLVYQRLIDLNDDQEIVEFAEELEDRFGRRPREVEALLESMSLRALLKRALISSVRLRANILSVQFHPKATLNVPALITLVSQSGERLRVSPQQVLTIRMAQIESPGDIGREVAAVASTIGLLGKPPRVAAS